MKLVLALSGAVASGKSTVANAVLAVTGTGHRMSTREAIIERKMVESERVGLQVAGDELDIETDFAWVADAAEKAAPLAGTGILIIDAVRRIEQVDRLHERFPGIVRHVHLIADPELLKRRHSERQHDVVEPASYEEVTLNETERQVDELRHRADIVFDAARLNQHAIARVALVDLNLVAPVARRGKVDVIVGGQYGSEGKGGVCSFLAKEYDVLMRAGGPNAGHRVRSPDFDFVHLPSGTCHNNEAKLLIGAGATLSLEVLLDEIIKLKVDPQRLKIDPQAIVIEQSDIAWEMGEGDMEAIGSTKKGVGAATARKILNRGGGKHFGADVRLARDVPVLHAFLGQTTVLLQDALAKGKRVMLEGTQGTDLSLHHGQWPHVTSRETTASGCMADAGVAPTDIGKIVIVVRTYPIRVGGASGYMGTEIDFGKIAKRSGLEEAVLRKLEVGTVSRKPRRVAEFDLGQVVRAVQLNGATEIALTFADYLGKDNIMVKAFANLNADTQRFVARIEDATGLKVTLISTHPAPGGMIDLRTE